MSFRLRNSNSRMARTILIDCEGLESEKKKSMLDHSKSMRFGAVHSRGADVFFLILLWVEKMFSKLVCTWRSNCSWGPFEEMWCADIEKWVADLAVEGLLFVKVSTKLDIHSLLTGSAAGPLAWSEIDPAHRPFDTTGPTKPNFQRPDRAGQRCKWQLVCEWVCTVTSVSVRIEKRANCAKNNKPKSGGLFLVNARPFPEHSSSRATFSAGRAWFEASLYTCTLLAWGCHLEPSQQPNRQAPFYLCFHGNQSRFFTGRW